MSAAASLPLEGLTVITIEQAAAAPFCAAHLAFAERDESAATEALIKADVAFASVNDMGGLSSHPHLRRITVDTSGGACRVPGAGADFHRTERRYGAVLAIGAHQPLAADRAS
jgi:crotonobetainyl-CoA:carnitine CoA-transferase CaiB-like acyl-CoA transferase